MGAPTAEARSNGHSSASRLSRSSQWPGARAATRLTRRRIACFAAHQQHRAFAVRCAFIMRARQRTRTQTTRRSAAADSPGTRSFLRVDWRRVSPARLDADATCPAARRRLACYRAMVLSCAGTGTPAGKVTCARTDWVVLTEVY